MNIIKLLSAAAVSANCLLFSAVQAQGEEMRVKFTCGQKETVILLEDNPAARRFFSMLPLKLDFSDYNATEKVAYLPEKLNTEGSPQSCDPKEGSLTYFIPWGNLALFYRDFRPSDNLVPLGKVVSGLENLASQKNGFKVYAEPMK